MEPRQPPTQERISEIAAENAPWSWKNLRSVGLGFRVWPIEWELGVHRWDDRFGGSILVSLGPFEFGFYYNDGSALKSIN